MSPVLDALSFNLEPDASTPLRDTIPAEILTLVLGLGLVAVVRGELI